MRAAPPIQGDPREVGGASGARRRRLRSAVRSPALLAGIAAALLAGSWAIGGPSVAGWTLVGLGGTAGYLAGTWFGIRVATVNPPASPSENAPISRRSAAILLVVFLLKAPPIFLLAIAAREARADVRIGLLTGAAVVYSVLVAWGLTPETPRARPDP